MLQGASEFRTIEYAQFDNTNHQCQQTEWSHLCWDTSCVEHGAWLPLVFRETSFACFVVTREPRVTNATAPLSCRVQQVKLGDPARVLSAGPSRYGGSGNNTLRNVVSQRRGDDRKHDVLVLSKTNAPCMAAPVGNEPPPLCRDGKQVPAVCWTFLYFIA